MTLRSGSFSFSRTSFSSLSTISGLSKPPSTNIWRLALTVNFQNSITRLFNLVPKICQMRWDIVYSLKPRFSRDLRTLTLEDSSHSRVRAHVITWSRYWLSSGLLLFYSESQVSQCCSHLSGLSINAMRSKRLSLSRSQRSVSRKFMKTAEFSSNGRLSSQSPILKIDGSASLYSHLDVPVG